MIPDNADILLVADAAMAAKVASAAGDLSLAHQADPYRALSALARWPYATVLLSADLPDLPGFVQAIRRLRPQARTCALCTPAGEARLRLAPPVGLDDCLAHPPRREELAALVRPAARLAPRGGAPAAPAELSVEELTGLIESAGTWAELGESVRRLVGRWTGLELRWVDPAEAGSAEPLLLADLGGLRVLAPLQPAELPRELGEKLARLQALLGALAGQALRMEQLHHLAITDHLTGAYNRRYFYHFTDDKLRRPPLPDFRATLLLFDIDNFKRYNDTYGHAVGDDILRETAQLLKRVTRGHDVVARIGGDEFAVLFWDNEPRRRPDSRHPQDVHAALAGRFLRALASHEFPSLGAEAKGTLTISGGLARFPEHGATCRELLRHADGALRQAKAAGKNAIALVGGQAVLPAE